MKLSDKNGSFKIFIRRHNADGSAKLEECRVYRLRAEETNEAAALHDKVAKGVSGKIFVPSPYSEIKRFLGEDGLAVGIRSGDDLIALRTLRLDQEWADEALQEYGLHLDPEEAPAVTGFCVVDRAFRGNNVQYLTQYLVEDAVAGRHTSIVTTVSPCNIFSLNNVLVCNFRIVGIKEVYGGYLRFIMKKDFRPSLVPIWTHGHRQIGIRDTDAQLKAINEGFVGYKLVRKHTEGFHILYAKAGLSQAD